MSIDYLRISVELTTVIMLPRPGNFAERLNSLERILFSGHLRYPKSGVVVGPAIVSIGFGGIPFKDSASRS